MKGNNVKKRIQKQNVLMSEYIKNNIQIYLKYNSVNFLFPLDRDGQRELKTEGKKAKK